MMKPAKNNKTILPSENYFDGYFFVLRDNHLRHVSFAGFMASGWSFYFGVN
jgi:hypothetical protein